MDFTKKIYPNRWVWVMCSLHKDSDVENIRRIVEIASKHGLNGVALSAGLDRLLLQPPDYFERLRQVKKVCDEKGIEIIPNIFSVGYGGSVLAHDRHLAAAFIVKDACFIAGRDEARIVTDPPVKFVNGEFEDWDGNLLFGYDLQDKPGEVTFRDEEVLKEGKYSLRLENFERNNGQARIMQELKVRPYRCYRIRCWVKFEDFSPVNSFQIHVRTKDRLLNPWGEVWPLSRRVREEPITTDWMEAYAWFNTLRYDTIQVYVGVWGGRSGKIYLDNLRIEEVGLLNVLRRQGTPITVRSEDTGIIYEEGRDYAPIVDPVMDFRFDRESIPIKLLPNSRIREGERLRVSYYHGMSIKGGDQVTVCMSEPKLYDIWRQEAWMLWKYLRPNKFLLSMDEIRQGGTCLTCRSRNMSMAEILGDCITRQVNILREVNPNAEIYIWSDMLDPHHNARKDYCLIEGDFTGSWYYVPKDLVIVCWYYEKREISLKFFSSLGFRTMGAAYYDSRSLENPRRWLEALDKTPNALGIMYTTWRNDYDFLADFGDLVM
ncbi:MAG: hypothetical protein QW782_03850, partial [Candidatus Bathyarchaeia archaeon]